MLVITRKESEEIVLRIPERTEPIVIRCCSIRSTAKVRIGIEAAKDIAVNRREVDNQIVGQANAVAAAAEMEQPEDHAKEG